MSKILRRSFLKAVAVFATSGALAWKSDRPKVEADAIPVIDVGPAVTGADGTVFFPGLDEMITTGYTEQPFAPYYLDPRRPKSKAVPKMGGADNV